MSDNFDKCEWQAEQAARDALMDKEREKHRKARERSARNAQRKLERLRRQLGEAGELSDWEDEFSESVTERLDKYGAAFADLQKGRPGDALSFAQKRVIAALNKKAKDKRKAARAKAMDIDDAPQDGQPKWDKPKKRSSFKSKNKKAYTPRVRQRDEDFDVEETCPTVKAEPFIPSFVSRDDVGQDEAKTPKSKRPFLRLVKTDPQDVPADLTKNIAS